MDGQYLACDLTGDAEPPPFETALMIDARVVSINKAGQVTLDAGIKAFATDAGNPLVLSARRKAPSTALWVMNTAP